MLLKKAIVLDKTTKEINYKQIPIIQCIGISNFSLLELSSEQSAKLQDIISTEDIIVKRIKYEQLTTIAQNELEKAIENIVEMDNNKFISFFNNAKPISLKRHQLDLLPMIGIKHRKAIIDFLKKNGPITSLNELKKIPSMPDPHYIIIQRILDEIKFSDEMKYFLFTIPFIKKIK